MLNLHQLSRPFSRLARLKRMIPGARPAELAPYKISQHPKNLHAEISEIYPKGSKVRNLTKPFEIPARMHEVNEGIPPTSPHSKYAQIAIVGPANSGKSTLTNYILNQNVTAVSNKVFTTDANIETYYTNESKKTQLKIYDTPGITTSANTKQRNQRYESSNKAYKAVESCEKVLYVVGVDKSVDEETIKSLKIIKGKTTLNLHKFTMRDFEGRDEEPTEEMKKFIGQTGLINDKTLNNDYLNNDDVGALEGLLRDKDKKSVMEEYQKSMNFDLEKPFSEEAPVSIILVLNKVRYFWGINIIKIG